MLTQKDIADIMRARSELAIGLSPKLSVFTISQVLQTVRWAVFNDGETTVESLFDLLHAVFAGDMEDWRIVPLAEENRKRCLRELQK